jgi:hypothetical protein
MKQLEKKVQSLWRQCRDWRFQRRKIKSLEPPDSFHVQAAQGWLGLEDFLSARRRRGGNN